MNIKCHVIPHTFHYISVHFVLNSASLASLSRRFTSARLAMFSGIAEICIRIAILRSSMIRGLVVYAFDLGYPQRK
jgi:hypothetical protein